MFVEANKAVATQLHKNLQTLNALEQAEVITQNAINMVSTAAPKPFDLVFLDPPFGSDLLARVMPLLQDNAWLADDALIYVEQPSKQDPESTPCWTLYKEGKAGHSRYTLYQA